ncbi:MAG: class I SAM-dependent methyltransferase [Chromatiaceae bacterium]|jgi:methyltransferase-like protein/protein-L-isoaspartate O-methyltransferase|nr:class I SAM-dependent methyltransferase [Chromatiaceae bacterium]
MPTLDSYDQVPYESFALPETHPDALAALGRLLGVPAAGPERCRVLELGAAAGGNLIPMAWALPGSEFVGVELGERQARQGQAMIERLGLRNIRLLHQDIREVDDGQAPFDYILVHGVYSWVPEAVRERILQLCGRLLAPQGIAYLSYNVLPGWHQRAMLREMLLHHSRAARSPTERLAQARELLELLGSGLADDPRPAAEALRAEVRYLRTARPSYLFHEYLEETNAPESFGEVMARASRHGLRYLADSELHSMFASTLGPAAQAVLARFETQVEQEQYMDFLTLRPFRRSLLVRQAVEPDLEIDLDRIADFGLSADLHPLEPPDLAAPRAQTYASPAGGRFEVEQPSTKALLARLAEVYPNALALDPLLAEACAGLPGAEREAGLAEVFNLYASGALGLTLRTAVWPNRPSERPRASALARVQAEGGEGHAASARHRAIELDPLAAALLARLDGQRDRAALTAELAALVASDPGLAAALGRQAGEAQTLAEVLGANLERLLRLFARNGLLER